MNDNSRIKIVYVNTVCNGSTGNMMHYIQKSAENRGFSTIAYVGRRKVYNDVRCIKFGNIFSFWGHVIINTLFDRQGHGSLIQTKKLINYLKKEKPTIIHLHNLHGYYLHIPTLIEYLVNDYSGRIVWTFHDLWPITGHCPHYVIAECSKWKTGCYCCANKGVYPISLGLDSSAKNYMEKKRLFSSLEKLDIIVPSKWMKEQLEDSFLKDKSIQVISNGIDLEIFHYCWCDSIYEKYKIPKDKKVILGVASVWEERKGLKTFLELAKALGNEYIIILVGLTNKQIKTLPQNVIGIKRTENKYELAALYSRSDIFVNMSKEESFSLVTVEAMACGTPVIVLDSSAVKELVLEGNGIILHNPDIRQYLDAIQNISEWNIDRNSIRKSVLQYSIENMTEKVIDLYENRLLCEKE